jgi:hypothetical protein
VLSVTGGQILPDEILMHGRVAGKTGMSGRLASESAADKTGINTSIMRQVSVLLCITFKTDISNVKFFSELTG